MVSKDHLSAIRKHWVMQDGRVKVEQDRQVYLLTGV